MFFTFLPFGAEIKKKNLNISILHLSWRFSDNQFIYSIGFEKSVFCSNKRGCICHTYVLLLYVYESYFGSILSILTFLISVTKAVYSFFLIIELRTPHIVFRQTSRVPPNALDWNLFPTTEKIPYVGTFDLNHQYNNSNSILFFWTLWLLLCNVILKSCGSNLDTSWGLSTRKNYGEIKAQYVSRMLRCKK